MQLWAHRVSNLLCPIKDASLSYKGAALSSKDVYPSFDDATLVFLAPTLLRPLVKDVALGFDDATLTPILALAVLHQRRGYNGSYGVPWKALGRRVERTTLVY